MNMFNIFHISRWNFTIERAGKSWFRWGDSLAFSIRRHATVGGWVEELLLPCLRCSAEDEDEFRTKARRWSRFRSAFLISIIWLWQVVDMQLIHPALMKSQNGKRKFLENLRLNWILMNPRKSLCCSWHQIWTSNQILASHNLNLRLRAPKKNHSIAASEALKTFKLFHANFDS